MADENLPRVSDRDLIERKADMELEGFFLDLREKHKLTYAESFSLLSNQLLRLSKTCLRAERRTKT